jgi:hypothetical protein
MQQDGDTRCRAIWIVDVLPHEIAPYISGQMDEGAAAMQRTLGRKAAHSLTAKTQM